jgi:hypothetical protein
MYLWVAITSAAVVAGGMRFFSQSFRLNLLIAVTLATIGSIQAYGIPAGESIVGELGFYIPLHVSAILLLDYLSRKLSRKGHGDRHV